jgi:hypothetical protein
VNDARYGLQNDSTHYENNDDICYILALGLLSPLAKADSFYKKIPKKNNKSFLGITLTVILNKIHTK